jgi:hypothetical protein
LEVGSTAILLPTSCSFLLPLFSTLKMEAIRPFIFNGPHVVTVKTRELRLSSRPAMGAPSLLYNGCRRPRREADHSPQTSVEVKKVDLYVHFPLLTYVWLPTVLRETKRSFELQSNVNLRTCPWPESASELYRQSDRRLSAKLVPTFPDRGCHVVSVTNPYGRILGFLDRSHYFSIK